MTETISRLNEATSTPNVREVLELVREALEPFRDRSISVRKRNGITATVISARLRFDELFSRDGGFLADGDPGLSAHEKIGDLLSEAGYIATQWNAPGFKFGRLTNERHLEELLGRIEEELQIATEFEEIEGKKRLLQDRTAATASIQDVITILNEEERQKPMTTSDFITRIPKNGGFSLGEIFMHLMQAEQQVIDLLASLREGKDFPATGSPMARFLVKLAAVEDDAERLRLLNELNLKAARGGLERVCGLAELEERWKTHIGQVETELKKIPLSRMKTPLSHPANPEIQGEYTEMLAKLLAMHPYYHLGQITALMKQFGLKVPGMIPFQGAIKPQRESLIS